MITCFVDIRYYNYSEIQRIIFEETWRTANRAIIKHTVGKHFFLFPPCVSAGAQRPDSISEVGEDAASTVQPVAGTALTEEEQEELRSELVKVRNL